MGALNSKALGLIANAYGDNTVYPSPVLSPFLQMQVDSDRYVRRFRQAEVVQLVGPPDAFYQANYEPGPDEAWRIFAATVGDDNAGTQDLITRAIVINPINDVQVVIPSVMIVKMGERSPIAGAAGFNFGAIATYCAGDIFVPAGATFRVQTSVLAGGPFANTAISIQLMIEVIPKQDEVKLLERSSVLIS